MTVRCASCGWSEDVDQNVVSHYGANHLRVCPKRDDLMFVPWWTTAFDGFFEVGWHPLDVNEPYEAVPVWNQPGKSQSTLRIVPTHRYRFTEYADREIIGVRHGGWDDPRSDPVRDIQETFTRHRTSLESHAVMGDIVTDMHTHTPIHCNACHTNLQISGGSHAPTCVHYVEGAA